MKTRQLIIILITTVLSGCLRTTLNLPPDKSKLEKIEAGTLESSVRIIAGKPDRIIKSKKGFNTYYYRGNLTSDCHKDLRTCIPIVLEKGKVVAVGYQWAKAWEKQRKRKKTAKPLKTAPPAKTDRETTRKEIAKLEKRARNIPKSRTIDNLNIYRYLLKLDPGNPRYQKKIAFYENCFEKEKAKRVAEKKQLAAERKWQNGKLKMFKGDTPVQMAVKILGNGEFYVWLKNTGKKPFNVEAQQFFLSCGKKKRYPIYSSKDFGKEVAPGTVIEGRIAFAIYCDPRKIIYANPNVATVFREIPLPEPEVEAPSSENKQTGKKKEQIPTTIRSIP